MARISKSAAKEVMFFLILACGQTAKAVPLQGGRVGNGGEKLAWANRNNFRQSSTTGRSVGEMFENLCAVHRKFNCLY